MELCLKGVLVALFAAAISIEVAAAQSSTVGDLQAFVDSAISVEPWDRFLWGIRVEDQNGSVLYERNSARLFAAASNRKLFVSAFVASCQGLMDRIPTFVYLTGTQTGQALDGDLVIKGDGDPSLAGRYDADRDQRLMPVIETLRARGIVRIGGVVADVSAFDRETIPGSWQTDDVGTYYAAPVDAIAFNGNVVGIQVDIRDCKVPKFTTDPSFVPASGDVVCGEEGAPRIATDDSNAVSVTGVAGRKLFPNLIDDIPAVKNPGLYAAQAFTDLLDRYGIAVDRVPRVVTDPAGWGTPVIVLQSPPIHTLVATILKESDNLYTEMLFKRMSHVRPATYAAALDSERRFLIGEAGLSIPSFRFADGSGLSANNYASPEAHVRIVRYFHQVFPDSVVADLFGAPGEDGTLSTRLQELQSRVRAKTGTIGGVTTLSGYVDGVSGGRRYFSILLNHRTTSNSAASKVIDAIVRKIAEF